MYRDKEGKRYSSRAEYMEAMDAKKKEKAKKHVVESELEWGGGMKQKKQKEETRRAMEAEVMLPPPLGCILAATAKPPTSACTK